MACSASWITKGSTESIQNTNIELKGVHENCTLAICNIRFPWGQDLYLRSLNKNGSETYYNPGNSSEYVIVKCVDTWCTTTGNAAEFEVCHEKPLESGKIRCITTPPGADIYFDGRKQVNKTPVTLTGVVPNKLHTIKFTKTDFLDASSQWSVKPGQTTVAERILIPVMQPGYINAISDLPDVTVKMIIEGKTYSYPAPHKFGAPAGRQVVFFSKPSHKQVEHSITVEPRQTVTLKGNPIPIVADTVLTLDKLPTTITEGDKLTLSGKLKTVAGDPITGTISFIEVLGINESLIENDKSLTAFTNKTGAFTATWTVKKMNSIPYVGRVDIIAKFDGTKTHNASKSDKQILKIKTKIEKGFIDVSSQPPNADVYFDGKKMLGNTPMHLSPDEIGKHKIKIVFGKFKPYEEDVEVEAGKTADVRHTFIAPSNLCSILGFDVTAAECSRAVFTLGVDFLTPIADAHVIKYHKSMYTGDPEDPTKWTYLFFLLGCIPIVGGTVKTVSKGGLKLTKEGAKLATLAKADPKLAEVLDGTSILSRIAHMSKSDVDSLFRLIDEKDYDKLGKWIMAIPETRTGSYANWHDEFVASMNKLYPAKVADNVVKHMDNVMESAPPFVRHVSYGNPEFWETFFVTRYLHSEELVKGGLGQKMADMCLEVAELGKEYPIEKTKVFIDNLVDIGEYDNLMAALSKSSKLNANVLAEYFKIFRKLVDAQKDFPDQTTYKNVLKQLGSLTHDAMSTHDATAMPKIANALFDASGNLKPLDDITESGFFKGIPTIRILPKFAEKHSDALSGILSGDLTSVPAELIDDFLKADPKDLMDFFKIFEAKPFLKQLEKMPRPPDVIFTHFINTMSTLKAKVLDEKIQFLIGKDVADAMITFLKADDFDSAEKIFSDLFSAGRIKPYPEIIKSKWFNSVMDAMPEIPSFTREYLPTFKKIAFGDFTKLPPDAAKYFIGTGSVDPDLIIDVLKYVKISDLLEILPKMVGDDSKIFYNYMRTFDHLTKKVIDPEILTIILKSLSNAMDDALSKGDVDIATKLFDDIFDADGNLRPFADIAKLKWFDEVAEIVPELTPFVVKHLDFIKGLATGKIIKVSAEQADELLEACMKNPDDIRDLLSVINIKELITALEGIPSTPGVTLKEFFRIFDKASDLIPDDDVFIPIAENIAKALQIAMKAGKPSEAGKIYSSLFDAADRLRPLEDLTKTKYFFDLRITLDDMIKVELTGWRAKAAHWINSKVIKALTIIESTPGASILIGDHRVLAIWFMVDNVPFMIYLALTILGLQPGRPEWITKDKISNIKDEIWNVRNACTAHDLITAAESLSKTEILITETLKYIDEHKTRFKVSGTYDSFLRSVDTQKRALELADCTPTEIPIPESGIIEDVFVSKVIDGDTIECRKDDETFKVRIVGINTPDKGPAGYSAACSESKDAETNTVWCSKDTYTKSIKQLWDLTDDKVISLKVDPKREKDIHGRYVALLTNKAGVEINLEMIKSGYACYYHRKDFEETGLFDHDDYIASRDIARDAKLGIWAPFELDLNIGYADFTTIPTGAQIYINNEYFTTTKKSNASFEIGTHSVRFIKEGFHPCEQEFEIKKDEKTPVTCTLKEITEEEKKLEGYALFRAFRKSSSGDLVSISADVWDETSFLFRTSPSASRAFQPGDHEVTFKRYNYEDTTTTFTIETNKTITVDVTMNEIITDPDIEDPGDPTEPHGTVDFTSSPSVAKIFVDGNYIGLTKKINYPLVLGTYTVMFEKDGYNPCMKTITVAVDEKVPCSCLLTKLEVEPKLPSYPDAPTYPTRPTRYSAPPLSYKISPLPPTAPPAKREPEAEPWEEFKAPMKVLFLNIEKEVKKQTTISTAGQKFIDKHCDLEFEWESEDHDMVELGMDDNDCATLDDTEELTEIIEPDKVPEGTKIIYLLWNADEPKCVSYTGFTGDTEDSLFDAMLCSSPTSKSKPEFTATTGKLKNDNLKIKYEGSLTIIIQICEALHELYEKTKSDDAEELPEFDDEFCKKDITDDRPNAKCVAEWLSKFNDAVPDEVKK